MGQESCSIERIEWRIKSGFRDLLDGEEVSIIETWLTGKLCRVSVKKKI